MRTEPLMYDDEGRLLTPMHNLGSRTSVFPGADPSLDMGFYHRHKVHENPDPRLAARNYHRFIAAMRDSVPGFVELDRRPYTVSGFGRHGVEILYAIENPRLSRAEKARLPRIPEPMLGHPLFR